MNTNCRKGLVGALALMCLGPTSVLLGRAALAAEAPEPIVIGTVVEDLRIPWGVALLPTGGALVSERDTARVVHVSSHGEVTEAGVVPGVVPSNQGGLLGLALSPRFLRDRWVYAFFTAENDSRIVRMRYRNGIIEAPEPVLVGIPRGISHNGGRIHFGPDGMLYAGTGDAGNPPSSQDLGSLGGKMLRMTPDGQPAPGNPFPDAPLVWSLGLRTAQGFDWDGRGRLFAADIGQDTWDELNLIVPGGNYGWPIVEGKAGVPEFIDPLAQWAPAEATPGGLAIAGDTILMTGLRGQRLWRIPLEGDGVGTPEAFFIGEFGRLRTIVQVIGPLLWMTTTNHDQLGTPRPGDDKILRVWLDQR
jgi:glucose/arabinose dehydrogenase